MAKAKRVRWECPNGKHAAVLGSTRPLKLATVRYCLPCSEEAGVLVERVAPAVERQRAAKTATAERRRAVKRERERAAAERKWQVEVVEADGSTVTISVWDTVRELLKLDAVKAADDRFARGSGYMPQWTKGCLPHFELRRRRDGHCSGVASPAERRFVVSIGRGLPREQVEELILHELLHAILPIGEAHGPRYRNALVAAARELWPFEAVCAVRNRRDVYEMDEELWRAAREAKS